MNTGVRGYGREHQIRRASIAPFVAGGHAVCVRCRELIVPGEPWDLGHVDGSRVEYAGPEHRGCNRATAGRNRKRVSREW